MSSESLHFAVALNDSDSSDHVLKIVGKLLRSNIKVSFLHSLPPEVDLLPDPDSETGAPSPSSSIPNPISGIIDAAVELKENYYDKGRAILNHAVGFAEAVVRDRRLAYVRLETALLPGTGGASGVARSIQNWAEAEGVEFLVVGSRGLGAFSRLAHNLFGAGSVTDWLAKNSGLSLLVSGPPTAPPPESVGLRRSDALTVCVGLDATSASRAALNMALRLAGPGGVLHAVSCGEALPSVDAYLAQVTAELVEAKAVSIDRDAASTSAGAPPAPFLVTAALPAVAGPMDICAVTEAYAVTNGCDLRVLGWGGPETKGHGTSTAALLTAIGMGSTAAYALHNPSSAMPTLLVRRFQGAALLSGARSPRKIVPLMTAAEEVSAVAAGETAQEVPTDPALGELMPAESLKPAGQDQVIVTRTLVRAHEGGRVETGSREAQGRGPEPAQDEEGAISASLTEEPSLAPPEGGTELQGLAPSVPPSSKPPGSGGVEGEPLKPLGADVAPEAAAAPADRKRTSVTEMEPSGPLGGV